MRLPVILKNRNNLLLTILFVLQCICNGAAIKCFVCDSSDNPSCADLKSNSSIIAEECTLDKTKSITTWLFDLNKFAYFDTGANKSPRMNCQKVVARDPSTYKMVTARFCQLDTGDSDACSILRQRLSIPEDNTYSQNNNNNNGKRGKQSQDNNKNNKNAEEEQFHCSICTTDRCNGSNALHNAMILNGCAIVALMLMLNIQWRYVWWW